MKSTVASAAFCFALAIGAAARAQVPVSIPAEQRQAIGVRFAVAQRRPVSVEIDVTGNIESDESRQSVVQTRFSGWIQRVFVDRTYEQVRRGEPLVSIYSPEIAASENELVIALAARDRSASSAIEGVAHGADDLVQGAIARLHSFGVPDREIDRVKHERSANREVEIDSPASGYVIERAALPAMYVTPDTKLYSISDLSRVWIFCAVFQDQIGLVKVGDRADVRIDTYPGEIFGGKIDLVAPLIDPATRSGRVRVELPNPKGLLMPGMYARVAMASPLGDRIVVPASAVLSSGIRNVAFIDRGDGYFRPVDVELGPRAGDDVVIQSGLAAGDRVVASASFLIDSESQLQAASGSYVPPPPGVAASSNEAQGAFSEKSPKIEFTSDPNPPARGTNRISITLRDAASGKPISGASVSVNFFMPGMPAMNMSAMRASPEVREDSAGVYRGIVDLHSGGTWQVTVSASVNGHLISTKRFEVSVTGPMSM